ncbi:MAG: cystathionine gamma-synthase [Acidiferrobacteraceae bacterium]|nr:cystathionine gamma-synthase [Acidiferrobacteraceae bacterium]
MTRDKELIRGIQTKAVHAGEEPDSVTGASAPNIVMSSTFVVKEPQGFSAANRDPDTPYVYSRWANPTVQQLQEKLASLEEAERCICFASGMAATSGLLFSLLQPGDALVISDTNYPGTAELVRNSLPRLGVDVIPVDTSYLPNVENAVSSKTRLVWIETPANPILRLSDIAAIADIAHRSGAELVVDSTFASPIATRPLVLGADYVVHSLTKYIGGHGDAMGGAVLGSRSAMELIETEGLIHFGGTISPFNAWLIQRGIATLPLRMDTHQRNAMTVAAFLENHPQVELVLYPGLASHPQHDLASKQMDNYSGMVSIRVAGGEEFAKKLAKELKVFHYAVSLGHFRSLIYWIGTEELVSSSYQIEGEQLEAYSRIAGDGVFRMSIGLEDPDDLCADLDQAFSK